MVDFVHYMSYHGDAADMCNSFLQVQKGLNRKKLQFIIIISEVAFTFSLYSLLCSCCISG